MLTRGDVEILDPVEAEQSWDHHQVPALPDDVAFTTGDWLALLRPAGGSSIRSWRTWKRLSGMVAVISGIALVVVTFSSGSPINDSSVNLETASATPMSPADDAIGSESEPSTLPLAVGPGASPNLLSSSEAVFLGLIAAPPDSTTASTSSTSTTEATTTTGWAQRPIPPESEWIDAGNGVAVPEVLLRIRYCESTNDYRAAHSVSSARGAYQFLTGSWEWYGHAARYGAATADQATPAQQDEAAVLTLQQDGTRPWSASRSCWGSNSLPANHASIRPPARATTTSTTETTTPSSAVAQSTASSSTSTSVSTTATTASTTSTSASSSTSDSTAASTSSGESTSSTTGTG